MCLVLTLGVLFGGGKISLDIDFNNSNQLTLASYPKLTQACALLMGRGDSSKLTLGALQGLLVRVEHPNPDFYASLEGFLTSVCKLTRLQVLIDKALTVQNLKPILRFHSETLRTLVWVARRGPRTQLDASISLLSTKLRNLRVIFEDYPSLTVLEIPPNWEVISSSDKFHEAVTFSIFTL